MNKGLDNATDVPEKRCLACGKMIKGRSDKKFCQEYCRNTFNNQRKEKYSARERHINKILHRNRSILCSVWDSTKSVTRVSKMDLLRQGFDFRYMTHVMNSDKGLRYSFCYEFGYADMLKEGIWVVGDPFTCH
jgi:predicted nucleic acid-binding Zn ribbon protein